MHCREVFLGIGEYLSQGSPVWPSGQNHSLDSARPSEMNDVVETLFHSSVPAHYHAMIASPSIMKSWQSSYFLRPCSMHVTRVSLIHGSPELLKVKSSNSMGHAKQGQSIVIYGG